MGRVEENDNDSVRLLRVFSSFSSPSSFRSSHEDGSREKEREKIFSFSFLFHFLNCNLRLRPRGNGMRRGIYERACEMNY